MKIALLIPCYNEEKTIKTVINDFRNEIADISIYVYDNNSSDNTFKIAKELGVNVCKEHKQGKGHVVRRMFKDIDADLYIMVDGDDTYPSNFIHQLIEPIINKSADIVIGDRLTNGTYFKENKRAFHGFGNTLVRNIINNFFKSNLKDIMSGYRVFSKEFVKTMPVLSSGFQIETEMTIYALAYNFRIKEITIDCQDRPEGSFSKLNTFSDGFKVMLTIFNLYRHYKPFLFFGKIALILMVLGFAIGTPVIYEYIHYSYIHKVASAILASTIILIAFLSFSVGLILDAISFIDRKNFEINIKH